MDTTDLLLRLDLDLADLKPAPARAANAQDARERLGPDPVPCVACGTAARSTRIIATQEHGRRWLDLCRDCMLATADRRRPTVPLAATLVVLRDAACEAGVALAVLVDELPPRPWQSARVDDPERYRLTLTSDGAVVMQGWWSNRATGERKFISWVGSYSAMPDARIVLTELGDDGTERVLQQWPNNGA